MVGVQGILHPSKEEGRCRSGAPDVGASAQLGGSGVEDKVSSPGRKRLARPSDGLGERTCIAHIPGDQARARAIVPAAGQVEAA